MKLTSRIITTDRTPVFAGDHALASVDKLISSLHLGRDGIFVLVDKNTKQHCLPLAVQKSVHLAGAVILEIDGGEASKSLLTAERLWKDLLAAGAGRRSLLVNLGGGVVSDLGGFVAAGYKRGIGYINIPTSLMGQADAAIGGKTSVNLGPVKNQVGFFYPAKGVFIFPGFQTTLSCDHLRSGMAEIIKSAIVGNARLWKRILVYSPADLLGLAPEHPFRLELLANAIRFKNEVVVKDFREQKLRKVLNFGHTIGHALEAYSQAEGRNPMLHGDAVAAGMVCAAFLSNRKTDLPTGEMVALISWITAGFPSYPVPASDLQAIMELMKHDKKNTAGQIRFTLISKPGIPRVDIACDPSEIIEALACYQEPRQVG